MNRGLQELLLRAGDWAAALTLVKAEWKPKQNGLTVVFYCSSPIQKEQEQKLQALLAEHLPDFAVDLIINTPAFDTPQKSATQTKSNASAEEETVLLGKQILRPTLTPMSDLSEEAGRVTIEGRLIGHEVRLLPKNPDRALLFVTVTDFSNTVCCKAFVENRQLNKLTEKLKALAKDEGWMRIRGDCVYDKFSHDLTVQIQDVVALPSRWRKDTAQQKRVELHLHTKMSAMDAVSDIDEAVKMAARFGHKAIAITDHGVVQAFPDAAKSGKKHGVKILFGVEGYLKQDATQMPMNQPCVVFDIETTGLKAEQGHIIEIGAVKIVDGKTCGHFSTFVQAPVPIPQNIIELTGIRDEMIADAPLARQALESFHDFCDGCLLVAHNASFDVGFIREHGSRYGIDFPQPYADTLMLSRYLLFELRSHKLNVVCEHLNVPLENHHRAVDDANATAQVFLKLTDRIKERGINTIPVVTPEVEQAQQIKTKRAKYNHVVLLAQTQAGLKNLYRLVSHAHIDFFHQKPQLPKSLVHLFREGLLIGSACEQGEIFRAVLEGKAEQELDELALWYDYLEIQPLKNNEFLLRNGTVEDEESLREFNRRIVELGKKHKKPVAATCDVHFLNPEDAVFRSVLLSEMGFSDALEQTPLYFKTTDEMLEEFAYLGEQAAQEVVVEVPNALADMCEELAPYPDGTFAPKIEGAEELLQEMALNKAHELYGENLPEIVQKRLEKEFNSIIGNGFASLYLMAQRLVEKSLSDGYLVGSRGSVGSSFVATMAGITEVNPLQPHYLCPKCKHSDFDVDRKKYACGVDMPDADCPECGSQYQKEGFEIPFEVFLGFHGDKTPDIDLNFSGDYQPVAHKFTEEMFGQQNAFRAGTISGVKEKTAYGYVMKYLEKKEQQATRLEIDRLCKGCSGVKRTTGQHPGGIVIVPKENDILEFTPIQYPADQKQKNTITTHFDFHALDDRLVKLDILGHDDPTALKMLQDITGIDPRAIPLNDPDTLSLYNNTSKLGISLEELGGGDAGSLGLPEFGTSFVRQMLMDTKPTTMEELVRIAGLSHGTDVWLNNAQLLVKDGSATLSEVICTRDDIMNYLILHGCEPSISFKTMENVRKGRGLTADMEAAMRAQDIPEWYIESCKKIKYMFPRAHAVAYVMMSFRVAYFKMHYPEAFYAVYFSVRADAFDVRFAMGGEKQVLSNIRDIKAKGKEASNQEEELLTILEVVYEMNLRGIKLLPVDIYKSDASIFIIEEEGIRAPFSAVAGIGATAARGIAQNTQGEKFYSIEDFRSRTGANKAVVDALEEIGCFEGMPSSNQISLF